MFIFGVIIGVFVTIWVCAFCNSLIDRKVRELDLKLKQEAERKEKTDAENH